ncbi:MAG: hypothetical protein COB67_00890 [SAR324 cluster bacterium]|uniref:protein-glutamate O-methyltransferase n=1 Tax=SAR324 cluster bacterium TaxID=2024889 RepID=A0A2A4TB33_9DELT|nr:MAG: hypothetical protein COB67_00890 [SAR324 cluster bacterium]
MPEEMNMSDAEFGQYQQLIYDTCGINFTAPKKQLLISRLRKRMNVMKIPSFRAYREHVTNPMHKDEFTLMLNAVSTNKTDFFRESVHFDFLIKNVYPRMTGQRDIRIWSAACSSGEESYTLGMTLLEHFGNNRSKNIKILSTDISTKVLDEAERGIYSTAQISPVPQPLLRKYFLKGSNQWSDHYLVKDCLKELTYFRRLNLMEKFPLSVTFDFIFCRNVMIYFDKITRERLVANLAEQLTRGGYLFIGNAESLSGIKTTLKYVQPAVYQKL